jgi:D-serine dehydratase
MRKLPCERPILEAINMTRFLDHITDIALDATTKGLPLADGSIRLGDIGQQQWNVSRGDMMLPVLILRDDHLRNNLEVMRRFADHHGVVLAPHGKSTFCPQLYRDQIELGGAWGITASTVPQAALVAQSGVENVLIANEIVGRANVEQLVKLRHAHPGKSFMTLVDSLGAMEELVRYGAPRLQSGERLQVLLEVGFAGGRAGVRDMHQAEEMIRALIARRDIFEFVGIECYEGLVSCPTPEETIKSVDQLLDMSVDVFRLARELDAFEPHVQPILTAGGSVFFDRVVERYRLAQLGSDVRIVIRGGSCLTYDHGIYRRQLAAMDSRGGLDMPEGRVSAVETFTPALELWAAVLALQDAQIAVLNMGIRDLPYDLGLPVPLRHYRDGELIAKLDGPDSGYKVTASNDQHCYMSYPSDAAIAVGDFIACGISHPCTAFDKWDVVYRVDSDFNVIGAVKTFF